jgi:hypothetical protein
MPPGLLLDGARNRRVMSETIGARRSCASLRRHWAERSRAVASAVRFFSRIGSWRISRPAVCVGKKSEIAGEVSQQRSSSKFFRRNIHKSFIQDLSSPSRNSSDRSSRSDKLSTHLGGWAALANPADRRSGSLEVLLIATCPPAAVRAAALAATSLIPERYPLWRRSRAR